MSLRSLDRAGQETLAFCTTISKNHLARARVLAESIHAYHPHSPVVVLLADRIDGHFQRSAEPFSLIELEDLPIPNLPRLCFQYGPLPLCGGAKPYLLEYLIHRGYSKLVYLDSDTLLLNPLTELTEILDRFSIVLTPHLTHPYPADDRAPGEVHIVRAGTYNAGFLALAAGAVTQRFLTWWKRVLYTGCQRELAEGMHDDQKWLDLVPAYFEGVKILRKPGYNVAYWNLHERQITRRDGRVLVNETPGYFMHYSGFDPEQSDQLSRHQNRLSMSGIGEARLLYEDYVQRLQVQGHSTCRRWPYAFAAFDNGCLIPDIARKLYLQTTDVERFGNPFITEGEQTYWQWLTSASGDDLPPLFMAIYWSRLDLRQAFPDVLGQQRGAYLAWMRTSGMQEYQLDPRLLLAAQPTTAGPVAGSGPEQPKPVAIPANARSGLPFGVNVAGYFQSEKGVGEAARAILRALDAVGIPYVLNNVHDTNAENRSINAERLATTNPYAINLVAVNGDQVPVFARQQPEYFQGRWNIGYWNWELTEFPRAWASAFEPFDEVWTPSTFTQTAIAKTAPVPVRWVPLPIEPAPAAPRGIGRARFGLPAEVFLFLFAFDYQSTLSRKNPLGVIRAFQRAFNKDPRVMLVLKTSRSKLALPDHATVLRACQGCSNIHLINEVLQRPEMDALLRISDAYVSLHRSEGFGLPLAEAMLLGKPVIATAYSANLDFMNADNSILVRYRLTTQEHDDGPYRRGLVWADADIDDAAAAMRRLVADPHLAHRLGEQAREDMKRLLNPRRIGRLIFSQLLLLTQQPRQGKMSPAKVLPFTRPMRQAA